MQLYNTLIESILNYGAEIWGYHKAPVVESILSKFCRKLLCVKRSTNHVWGVRLLNQCV